VPKTFRQQARKRFVDKNSPRAVVVPLLLLLFSSLLGIGGSESKAQEPRARILQQAEERLKAIYERREYNATRFSADWSVGGSAFTRLENRSRGQQELVSYDAATGRRSVVISTKQLMPEGQSRPTSIRDYEVSGRGNAILLEAASDSGRGADLWLFDTTKKALRKLVEHVSSYGGRNSFSPDSAHILYRKQRGLFAFALQADRSVPLAKLSDGIGFQSVVWSPNGNKVAFVQSDDRNVKRRAMLIPTDPTYPEVARRPFALIGTPIPVLRVGVVDVTGGPVTWVDIPEEKQGFYIGDLGWTKDSKDVLLKKLSRSRDSREFFLADAETGKVRRIYHETDPAWVEASYQANAGLDWINGGKEFLILSEKDGWRQAFVFSREGEELRCLTPGKSDIINRGIVDQASGWFYYIASPDNATQRYLYRVRLDGAKSPERITPPDQSGSHDYDFSPDGRWALHTWSTFDTPPTTELVSLPQHETIRVLEDNRSLRDRVAPLIPRPTEFFELDIDEGVKMDAWMVKPRDFDPTQQYPVFVFVYGEPHGQTVLDDWNGGQRHTMFHRVLADIGYLIVSIDNRGTPAPKGAAWRRAVYGSLGPLSTKEQAAGLRELGRTQDYVDMSRIGIWGWSGGGSNTLNAMFREPGLYQVGIAVAPKPQPWLYNAWFQEIYMGTREDNPEGYRKSAPINFAEGLQGDLLIVHGSGETNTHIQITEGLVDRLIELGKRFDYMVYPNRNHGLGEGKGTAVHLRMLMTRYLIDHLPPGPRNRNK
jgi:dipeptidyl-peptidase-4